MKRKTMSVFAAAVLAVFVLAHMYVGTMSFRWLSRIIPGLKLPVFCLMYLPAACLLLAPLFSGKRWLSDAGSVWMGVFMYLFIFTVLAGLVMLMLRLFGADAGGRASAIAGWAVITVTLAVSAFGYAHAENIRTACYEVKGECAGSGSLKIVLVSDLHLGSTRSETRLLKTVQAINRQDPDIVCIAGDIFNNDFSKVRDPESVKKTLAGISSRYGVFACLGNHDSGDGIADMTALVEASGIRLLVEESETVGGRFIICGRADSSPIGGAGGIQRSRAFRCPDNPVDLPVIVLDHNPAKISGYGAETDLVLCGHTHRGQVYPGRLITHAMYDIDYGYLKKDPSGPAVVVTSGAGCWGPPMRIGSDAEIAVIDFGW